MEGCTYIKVVYHQQCTQLHYLQTAISTKVYADKIMIHIQYKHVCVAYSFIDLFSNNTEIMQMYT